MSAVSLQYEIKNAGVKRAFNKLVKLGNDTSPLMQGIATILENSTRERFADEVGPDGEDWEQSLRAKLFGGKTLTKDGHLGDSISSQHSRTTATVGSNRIYAAIHQFGGFIQAKPGKALRFEFAGAGTNTHVTVQNVFIPARPFLGVSDMDSGDVEDFIHDKFRALLK